MQEYNIKYLFTIQNLFSILLRLDLLFNLKLIIGLLDNLPNELLINKIYYYFNSCGGEASFSITNYNNRASLRLNTSLHNKIIKMWTLF